MKASYRKSFTTSVFILLLLSLVLIMFACSKETESAGNSRSSKTEQIHSGNADTNMQTESTNNSATASTTASTNISNQAVRDISADSENTNGMPQQATPDEVNRIAIKVASKAAEKIVYLNKIMYVVIAIVLVMMVLLLVRITSRVGQISKSLQNLWEAVRIGKLFKKDKYEVSPGASKAQLSREKAFDSDRSLDKKYSDKNKNVNAGERFSTRPSKKESTLQKGEDEKNKTESPHIYKSKMSHRPESGPGEDHTSEDKHLNSDKDAGLSGHVESQGFNDTLASNNRFSVREDQKVIEPQKGELFKPELHEEIESRKSRFMENKAVLKVVENGLMENDHVVKKAKVVINRI